MISYSPRSRVHAQQQRSVKGSLSTQPLGPFDVSALPLRNRIILSGTLVGMAHTYGEVLPPSFPHIFSFARDPQQTVFIDAGSGYGALLAAAVTVYGCSHAIGVEKYKDKYHASLELVRQMPQALQQRVTIVLQDINDTDIMPLLDSLSFQTLLFFCNNVAFRTIHRYNLFCISTRSLR